MNAKSDEIRPFPPPSQADDDGLLCIDELISADRLLSAYRQGIFPWPWQVEVDDVSPVPAQNSDAAGSWQTGWFSPDPRSILPLDHLHVSRRLSRKLRQGKFLFGWNAQHALIIEKCRSHGDRCMNPWLSPQLVQALGHLADMGYVVSVEVYLPQQDKLPRLVGGLYGVCAGAMVCAESMFSEVSDASKAAVCMLVHLMRQAGCTLLDIQQPSAHMTSMGALSIPRRQFLAEVKRAVKKKACWPTCPEHPIPFPTAR